MIAKYDENKKINKMYKKIKILNLFNKAFSI